ncbi:MAG TPA: IclR family transcriptional regulator C-terminal domain-containing protein, partial [Burkholderiaceae bacterium]|nr:IclR family transcriptional regulator C-terminal domain-containing protein [Burkholderiaceae bacterium]
RAYLAAAPASERHEILERLREVDDRAWQKIEAGVDAALDEYARTGCCSSMGEWNSQVNSVAAPFDPGGGLPRMAVNVAGLAQTYPRERILNEFRPMLLELVARIESQLGRRQPR